MNEFYLYFVNKFFLVGRYCDFNCLYKFSHIFKTHYRSGVEDLEGKGENPGNAPFKTPRHKVNPSTPA